MGIKILDKDICKFYNISRDTLSKHKNNNDTRLTNRYNALRAYYIASKGVSEDSIKLSDALIILNSLDISQGISK